MIDAKSDSDAADNCAIWMMGGAVIVLFVIGTIFVGIAAAVVSAMDGATVAQSAADGLSESAAILVPLLACGCLAAPLTLAVSSAIVFD